MLALKVPAVTDRLEMARKQKPPVSRSTAPPPRAAQAPAKDLPPWLLAVPLGLAALAYARTLRGEFQFDDYPAIVENPAIKTLGACLRRCAAELASGAGRPVTDASFALNYAASRLAPWGFHAGNLAVHLAAAALAFAFVRALLRLAGAARTVGPALFAAGVFALHPLQSEAVSYVVQRAESLASALYLLALLCLLAAERAAPGRARLAWAGGLAVFTLALGAKAIAVTLPVAFLLCLALVPGPAAREGKRRWSRRLWLLLPWLLLDAWFALSTLRATSGHADVGFSVPGLPPRVYFLSQWRVIATYLRLLFFPSGQSVYWGFQPSRGLGEPAVLACGLLLLGLVAGAVLLARFGRGRDDEDGAAARVAAFGIGFFFLVLAPTSSVVPLADLLAEHRVYLASLGIFAALAVAGERLLSRLPEARRARAAALSAGLVWALLFVALFLRNAVWETQVALWRDAVAKAPHHQRPHQNLAHAEWGRGDYQGAVRELRLALDAGGRLSAPDEAFLQGNLGAALVAAGRFDEAEATLSRALLLQPASAVALGNLAFAQLRLHRLDEAEDSAKRALALDPRQGGALEVLGGVRMQRGDAAGALQPLERAVRADPDDGQRWFNLAEANQALGRTKEACGSWQQAAQRTPALREEAARRESAVGCRLQ